MDKSVDSIGSCSLDVDAETTDFSDTSGSLNFPTPVSLNDLPGDFGTDLRGRTVVKTNESKLIEPMVMAESKTVTGHTGNLSKTNTKQEDNFEIKPSYLNIACCVNGYSNLTTYDSKVRQDINKSREVSPIRPSSNSLQYCKKSDSLLPPVLLALPNAVEKLEMPVFIKGQNNNNHNANSLEIYEEKVDSVQPASFIQQRVERLYGPGALAQGFYSPRKQHDVHVGNGIGKSTENNHSISELSRKFKEFSPSKDYNPKSLKSTNRDENSSKSKIVQSVHNNNIDLPVLRHLSQEFRAQLPAISPKKVQNCVLEEKNSNLGDDSRKTEVALNDTDVVDKVVKSKSSELMPPISTKVNTADNKTAHTPAIVKDGQYFLTLLKAEQKRILILAAESEKYTDALSSNPDIGDDILGLLRAFTGKARLLVNQKLKQFEGLCHNNMNRSGEDKFPTTDDDLQGFWDMVYLQIDHVDTIYKDIEHLKNNDWKKEPPLVESIAGTQKNSPKPLKGLGLPGKSVRNKSELSPAAAAAALKREAQRKQLMEMKRKKKMEMASNDLVATAVEKSPFEDSKSIQIEITEQNSQIDV